VVSSLVVASLGSGPLLMYWGLAPGVTIDPLGSFPWGVSLEAGGNVAAPLAEPGVALLAASGVVPLAASDVPVPAVVLVGTMLYWFASLVVSLIGRLMTR